MTMQQRPLAWLPLRREYASNKRSDLLQLLCEVAERVDSNKSVSVNVSVSVSVNWLTSETDCHAAG